MRTVAPTPEAATQLLPLLPSQLAPAGLCKPCSPLDLALVAKHGRVRWLAPLGGIQGVFGIGSNWCVCEPAPPARTHVPVPLRRFALTSPSSIMESISLTLTGDADRQLARAGWKHTPC